MRFRFPRCSKFTAEELVKAIGSSISPTEIEIVRTGDEIEIDVGEHELSDAEKTRMERFLARKGFGDIGNELDVLEERIRQLESPR